MSECVPPPPLYPTPLTTTDWSVCGDHTGVRAHRCALFPNELIYDIYAGEAGLFHFYVRLPDWAGRLDQAAAVIAGMSDESVATTVAQWEELRAEVVRCAGVPAGGFMPMFVPGEPYL